MARLARFEAPSRQSVEESLLFAVQHLSPKHLSSAFEIAEGLLADDSLRVGWIASESEGSVAAIRFGDNCWFRVDVSPIEANLDFADPEGLDVTEEVSATGD